MLKNGKVLEINAEEGQFLLVRAVNFHLPPELGEAKHSVVDQSMALHQVGELLKALTMPHSPYMQAKGDNRKALFGKRNVWEEFDQKNEKTGNTEKAYRFKDSCVDVYKLDLNKDGEEGIVWLFYLELHPKSEVKTTAQNAVDFVWPMAQRIGIEKLLRTELGLSETVKSRWADKKRDYEINPAPKLEGPKDAEKK